MLPSVLMLAPLLSGQGIIDDAARIMKVLDTFVLIRFGFGQKTVFQAWRFLLL